jgi:hypothetical protein
MAERNVRNRKVSAPENDGILGQSFDLSDLDKVDCQSEFPSNEYAIAVPKNSTRQEGNISGNMNAFFTRCQMFYPCPANVVNIVSS